MEGTGSAIIKKQPFLVNDYPGSEADDTSIDVVSSASAWIHGFFKD